MFLLFFSNQYKMVVSFKKMCLLCCSCWWSFGDHLSVIQWEGNVRMPADNLASRYLTVKQKRQDTNISRYLRLVVAGVAAYGGMLFSSESSMSDKRVVVRKMKLKLEKFKMIIFYQWYFFNVANRMIFWTLSFDLLVSHRVFVPNVSKKCTELYYYPLL